MSALDRYDNENRELHKLRREIEVARNYITIQKAEANVLNDLAIATTELIKAATLKPGGPADISREQMIFNLGSCLGVAKKMQSILNRVERSAPVEFNMDGGGSDD